MSNSFHLGDDFDSFYDMSSSNYGITVLPMEWPWSPEAVFSQTEIPAKEGVYIDSSYMRNRVFQIPCRIAGDSASDLRTKFDNILGILSARVTQYVHFDQWPDRIFEGRFVHSISGGYKGTHSTNVTLTFTCLSPYAYAREETTQTLTITSDPDSFTVPASGVVPGTAPADPVWLFKNTSGGVVDFTIANSETSEKLSIDGVLNGTWVRMTRATRFVETSTDSGSTWGTAMDLVGTYLLWPRLSGGASETIVTTGTDSASVEVTYRGRYL